MNKTRSLLTIEGRAYPIRSLVLSGAAILDACAVRANFGHLLVLKSDGELCGVNLDDGQVKCLCRVELPYLQIDGGQNHFGPEAYRLHASTSGRFCAIVVDKGRKGVVVDTLSGAVTMSLDGGDYYENTVPFSACFLHMDGQEVFVHRSEWNRLEASDPATGRSLTERFIAPYEAGGERPAHYLDYFHGRLSPSPDGSRILDDGWVWHPVSIPRIWSATEWLRSNPWESEDGNSIIQLAMRDDWNTPVCWISEHRVAMWGLTGGDCDEAEEQVVRPGVQIYNAASMEQSPDDQWAMNLSEEPDDLFSDGKRLFVVGEKGTSVWDISSRLSVASLPDFSPRLYDPKRGSLIAIEGTTLSEFSTAELLA